MHGPLDAAPPHGVSLGGQSLHATHARCLRRDPFNSHDIHTYNFGVAQKGGGFNFNSGRLHEYVVKTEIARAWPRLKLGEGKAENQNNMINALFGEVVNLLDMNQVFRGWDCVTVVREEAALGALRSARRGGGGGGHVRRHGDRRGCATGAPRRANRQGEEQHGHTEPGSHTRRDKGGHSRQGGGAQQGKRGNQDSGNREPEWRGWESVRMGGSDNKGDGLASQPRRYRVLGQPLLNRHQVGGVSGSPDGLFAQQEREPIRGRPAVRGKRTYGGRPGQRVEEQGTWASRARKHSEAGYGRPVDRGAWTAKTVKRPRQQPAHP